MIQDSDLSTMENEIMQKSGIDISSKANEAESSAPAVEQKPKLQRQETPALVEV